MSAVRRNILIVAPFLPFPADFGGALRVFHLVRGLQRHHDVHVVAPVTPDERDNVLALGEFCDVTAVPAVRSARQPAITSKRIDQIVSIASIDSFLERSLDAERMQAAIDRIFLTRRVDLMQYEFSHTASVRPTRPVPTIIDAHNIEYQLLQRVARTSANMAQEVFNRVEWRKVRHLEERAWKSATLVTATSTIDAAVIKHATGVPVSVVPNGVDVRAFSNLDASRKQNTVIFTGAMRHYPNAVGARWYAERVHPLVRDAIPNVKVSIVGADPPPDIAALASDSITVTGRVERIEPYLASASVAIVPLHAGSGTRLKILEAFAAYTPVVSTTIGAEGVDAEDGIHILIRDKPDEFAEAVIAALRNEFPITYSAERAFQLAHRHYDWDTAILPMMLEAHEIAISRFADMNGGGQQ